MNGDKLVVDTNIIIFHLSGDRTLERLLEGKELLISFVSDIEIRSLKNLSPRELKVISHFTDHVEIIHSTTPICREAATLRRAYGLKTPDAIIASTAICLQLPLITADQRFYSLAELQCIRYQPA